MHLRRRDLQRQNIEQKDSGQVEWVTGLFWILMLSILLCTQLQISSWRTTGMYMEDALAASNLASALIDLEEYGKTNKVLIPDPEEAYVIYLDAIRDNLQLDGQWECENKALISGPVEIADYIVYNVDGDRIYADRVGSNGMVIETWSGEMGRLAAPNGVAIEHTWIYSEIQFPVQGFLGVTVSAHKGKLVDIAAERRE